VGLGRIEADTDNFGVERRDLRASIAKAAGLTRSTGCEVLGKEVQDDVPAAAKVA